MERDGEWVPERRPNAFSGCGRKVGPDSRSVGATSDYYDLLGLHAIPGFTQPDNAYGTCHDGEQSPHPHTYLPCLTTPPGASLKRTLQGRRRVVTPSRDLETTEGSDLGDAVNRTARPVRAG
jgi:hypothetical protein